MNPSEATTNATAPLVDLVIAASAEYGVCSHTLATNHTQVLAKVFKGIKANTKDHDPSLFHVHPQPFLFHTLLLSFKPGNAFLKTVNNDDQVIGEEDFPGDPNSEITRQGLKDKDK